MIGLWLCGTEVAFDMNDKASYSRLASQFPLRFLPETSKLQSAVYSEWKQFCLIQSLMLNTLKQKKKDLMIDILAPPFANRQQNSQTHKNLVFSRVITKAFVTFINTSTSKLETSIFHLVYRVLDFYLSGTIARNRSIFPRAFTSTPECPDIKSTIDCACLQSYIRQILPSFRYYKE